MLPLNGAVKRANLCVIGGAAGGRRFSRTEHQWALSTQACGGQGRIIRPS